MKRKNTTRNALFTSIISLLLCVSMLVGTTFAWFTDTAASGLNQIIAGNLDVELLYKDGDEYKNAADVKLFDDIELWEPGMVVYETVKIANVGNLALKYAIEINTANENNLNGHGLSEVLHFAVLEGEVEGKTRAEVLALAEASADKGMLTTYTFGSGKMLEANTKSEAMTLVVYWPASNNEFDNLFNVNNGQKTSDGAALHIDLGLTVYASQETVEKDSFDKWYDDTASYPDNMWLGDVANELVVDVEKKTVTISSGAELAKFAEMVNSGENKFEGYTVELTDSIDLGNIAWTPINFMRGTFNGNGHTIYNLNVDTTNYEDPKAAAGFFGNSQSSTITKLNVVNAKVSGNNFAGVISGVAVCGRIDECTVTNAVITTSAAQIEGKWDNGAKAGGIIGYVSSQGGTAYVKNCTVKNAKISGYRDIGGIAGFAQYYTEVTGNTVEDVELICDLTHNYENYADKAQFNFGEVTGRENEDTVINNNTVTNVTIKIPDMVIPGTSITLYKAENKGDGGTIYLNSAEDFWYLNTLATDWDAITTPDGNDHYHYRWNWEIVLNCDVDLENKEWTPMNIGAFGGFDGQGHTISNLKISGTADNVALFSSSYEVNSGECPITNFVVDGANVSGANKVAVVVGWATTPVTNVTVKNATVNGAKYVGGIVGKTGSNIENCSVINSSVIAETKEVGGIVGYLDVGDDKNPDSDYTITVTNCAVKNSTVTGTEEVGGIVGRAYARESTKIELNNNIFDGIVNATTETKLVGEILGSDHDGSGVSIDGVVLVGDVSVLKDALAAGTTAIDANGANLGALNYGLSKNNVPAGTTVTIKNAVIEGKSYGNGVDGTVIFENCTFTRPDGGAYSIHFDSGSGNVVFNNCKLDGWCSFGSAIKSVEMNDCTFTGNGTYALLRFYQDVTLTNCTFDCSNANTEDNQYYPEGIDMVEGYTANIKNCTNVNGTMADLFSAHDLEGTDGKVIFN